MSKLPEVGTLEHARYWEDKFRQQRDEYEIRCRRALGILERVLQGRYEIWSSAVEDACNILAGVEDK